MAAALCFIACAAMLTAYTSREAGTDFYQAQDVAEKADIAYNLAMKYYTGDYCCKQDLALAASWFRKAADLGHVRAQFYMGSAYDGGYGVERDYEEAYAWYRRAAAEGDRDAQSGLGGLYAAGNGVEQDYEKAAAWYRRAAEGGIANAQHQLGLMYLAGRGVEQDYEEAYFWLALGAKEFDEAMEQRDEAAEHLTDEELETLWERLAKWLPVE